MKRILWIENNLAWSSPYVFTLRENGYTVDIADSLTVAEDWLSKIQYDLVIIDPSIPILNLEEEEIYPPAATDRGKKAGLALYRRHKERLAQQGTKVMVLTIRAEASIQEEFVAEGLPPANFNAKLVLREVRDFLAKVEEIQRVKVL